jgi:hypothetical protein
MAILSQPKADAAVGPGKNIAGLTIDEDIFIKINCFYEKWTSYT